MARQKAGPEGTQTGREMAENRSAPRAVTRVPAPAAQGLRAATRPNKRHRAGTILALAAPAASNGTPADGFPGPGEHAGTAGRTPAAGRARQAMQARDAAGARRARAASARGAPRGDRRGAWHARHTQARARSPGAARARQARPRADQEGKAHDGAGRGQQDAGRAWRRARRARRQHRSRVFYRVQARQGRAQAGRREASAARGPRVLHDRRARRLGRHGVRRPVPKPAPRHVGAAQVPRGAEPGHCACAQPAFGVCRARPAHSHVRCQPPFLLNTPIQGESTSCRLA